MGVIGRLRILPMFDRRHRNDPVLFERRGVKELREEVDATLTTAHDTAVHTQRLIDELASLEVVIAPRSKHRDDLPPGGC